MNELVSFDLFESLELAALPGFGVTALLALRLLAAWYYLGERLTQETLYFEESGWYDGFLQTKPAQTLYRDRLAYQDQVAPVLRTLFPVTAVATLLFLGVCSADASILGSHSAQYAAEQFTDATQGGGGFYGVAVPEPAAAVSTVVETAAPSALEF